MRNRTGGRNTVPQTKAPMFIDLFAGCGGLSLGLFQAGWKGLFAIEHDRNAFETLQTNLLSPEARYKFNWPDGIPQAPLSVDKVLVRYRHEICQFSGELDLLAGGPPCQGFSSAGRRDPSDPRNKLVESYLKFVHLLRPRMVLIENVCGITADFQDRSQPTGKLNYASWLQTALADDYIVFAQTVDLMQFGVPQRRQRFFIIAIRKDIASKDQMDPFELIEADRPRFLEQKSISVIPVAAKSAISDLEVSRNGKTASRDSSGFEEIAHKGPLTRFQQLLNAGVGGRVSDTRLARHKPVIVRRFRKIIALCQESGRLNVSLSRETRESLGLLKCAIRVMDPNMPSPTITSMPDDLIHYREPRCLTVRENARLQTFPDWFKFKGKYTTGGNRRRREVPRFTQVANAVPPLVAEAIGVALSKYVQ